MRLQGRIEIGPFGGASKSARQHQAFLVPSDGRRLLLRRYDGPPMRDETLEALAGREVVCEGQLRGDLFIATSLEPVDSDAAGPAPGTGRAKRRP